MDIFTAALVLIVIAAGIAVLCWNWMKSTRASQRKTEAQNERIIELLETIAAQRSAGAPPDAGRASPPDRET